MVKNNHPVDIPKTYTVSYYNPETGQNLTTEEWNLIKNTSPTEIKIVNQGEVYRSWKTGVDYPAYGPMPFVDEATALIVSRADSIMTRLNREYPNVVSLFNHNRSGTVEWLKAEGALAGYNVVHNFKVDFTDSTSKNGPKAWQRYRDEIEIYVEKLCGDWRDNKGDFKSRLRNARGTLASHIHGKYFDSLPSWPSVGEINRASIELDTGDAYEKDNFYIVWSCVGWVSVKDERPSTYIYMAEFSGKPDTKILQLDFDKLGELNRKVDRIGYREAERIIDAKEGTRDSRLLTWEDFK